MSLFRAYCYCSILISLLLVQQTIALQQQKYQTYQHLYYANNHLHFQFNISNQHLHFPLQNIIDKFNIQEIAIKYGSITMDETHYEQQKNNILSRQYEQLTGISLWIKNNQQDQKQQLIYTVAPQLQQLLSGIFSVSITNNPKYLIYLQQSNYLMYSSPNDKFCIQHIQAIIRNVLPCSNYAGVAMLLDVQNMIKYSIRRHLSMKVSWTNIGIKVIIKLQHIGHKNTVKQLPSKIIGLKRLKLTERCSPFFDDFSMTDAMDQQIKLNEVVVDKLYESIRVKSEEQQQNNSEQSLLQKKNYQIQSITRRVIGDWYSTKKQLQISLNAYILNNSHRDNSNDSNVFIVREILPPGCQVQSLSLISTTKNTKIITKDNYCTDKHQSQITNNLNSINRSLQDDRHFSNIDDHYNISMNNNVELCTIPISVNSTAALDFILSLNMQCQLVPFEQYENIYGGGVQLCNIPIALLPSSLYNDTNTFKYLQVPRVTLRTPLPDEGIPFVIITLTLVLLAYTYIVIWKNVYFQNNNKTDNDIMR